MSLRNTLPLGIIRIPKYLRWNCLFQLCLFFFVLSTVPVTYAQEYRGTISGRVTDQSGNVIPNASIKSTSPEQTYNGKTDSKGDFYIPYVQPGTYKISAEALGFKTVVHNG